MKSINFDEGYKEYALNGDEQRIVRVRLSDPNILGRIETAMSKVKEMTKKYKGRPDAAKLAEFDAEIKQLLNESFGSDICTPVFGGASVMTPTSDGNILIFSFFDAFMPVLKADIEAMKMTMKLKQSEPRPEVQKYLEPVTVKPVSKSIAALADPYAGLPDVSGYTPEQKRALMAKLL